MASHKRRGPFESDDDSDHDSAVHRSVSESSARKRRRTSDNSSASQNASSDNDGDAGTSTSPSDLDMEEDEEEEMAATQAIRARHAEGKTRGNEPAESGILEMVEVTNFMCHERMEFKLGPLINFICGKNGSGKSAILTAILLCLGGRAAATNRGTSLKDLIKEGKDYATIVCKLKNQGDTAYMHDDYGDTIQVERYFSRTGASGFKLKNARGRVISTKRVDLDEICDHFTLQMENPLNVLSQDQARQFISTSSAAEKYKFFVKGVLLEQLDQDYRLIEEQLDNIEPKIEAKRPDIKILEQRWQSAQNKLELSRRHEGLLEKLRDYRRQIAWAQIETQEAIRDDYIREIKDADRKIEDVETKITELDDTFHNSDRLATEAKAILNTISEDIQQVNAEKAEGKIKQDEAKKEASDVQADQRKIRLALRETNETIDSKKQEIQQEEQRLAELDGGGAAKRLRDLEEARQNVTHAQKAQQVHDGLKAQLTTDIEVAAAQEKDASQAVTNKKAEIEQQSRQLENIRSEENAEDSAYHPKMSQLLRAIEREKRFERKPAGPLGKHIKLLQPEWSSILEKSFGGTLNGFVVTNKKDQHLLSDIMKTMQIYNIPVMIGNNHPLDTRPNEPDDGFNTVLRSLEINNDHVRKILVIQHSIENTLLIADQEKASQTLFRDAPRPRNAQRCYCFHPKTRTRGVMLHHRGGKPAQDPIDQWTGKPRMKTNLEAQIRLQQNTLDESKSQLLPLEEEFRCAQDRHVKAKQALVRHKRREAELRVAVQEAEDRVEGLTEAINEDRMESGKLDVLQQALSVAEEQVAMHEESYIDSQVALDERKKKLREVNMSLNAFDDRMKEMDAASQRAQLAAQKADKKRAFDLGEKNAAIGRVEDARKDRDTLERKRVEKETQIAEWTEQARQVCERVNIPEGETFDSLDKKYKRLQIDYQRSQKQIGASREEVEASAAKATHTFNKSKKDLEHLEELSTKLKGTLIERRERWKLFRSFIAAHAKGQFTYLLSERSFRGKLITDHKQKLLELSVEPDITKRDGSGRGARTLSGGEKSFSQICLLLAIWEAMGSPIRCLDEFDVFMDAVNRNTSVNLLIEAARQSPGKQYILISPGTKSDIKKAPDVQVLEIAPPERGQTRLVLPPA